MPNVLGENINYSNVRQMPHGDHSNELHIYGSAKKGVYDIKSHVPIITLSVSV